MTSGPPGNRAIPKEGEKEKYMHREGTSGGGDVLKIFELVEGEWGSVEVSKRGQKEKKVSRKSEGGATEGGTADTILLVPCCSESGNEMASLEGE